MAGRPEGVCGHITTDLRCVRIAARQPRKLAGEIRQLANRWSDCDSFAEARSRLADKLAPIELFPNHSKNFKEVDGWRRKLPSVALARAFVTAEVLLRVRRRDSMVIVLRGAEHRGLTDGKPEGVTVYDPRREARATSLSPTKSRGGKFLDHLVRDWANGVARSSPGFAFFAARCQAAAAFRVRVNVRCAGR